MSLRNEDYTDRELLAVVDDLTPGKSYASTSDIAERIGLTGDNPRRAVGSRMSWMVRYGFCERNDDPEKKDNPEYRLTKAGRDLRTGNLSSSLERALDGLSPGDRVLVMRSVAGSAFARATPEQDAVRREYGHHFAKRRRRAARSRTTS